MPLRTLPLLLLLAVALGCAETPDNAAVDADPAETSEMEAVTAGGTDGLYELRTYYPEPGRRDDLLARFRDHTADLFERHGMTNVAYWTPIDPDDDRLIYVLSYPDSTAREAAWDGFLNDPDWIAARDASEADGPLVDRIESTFMTTTDFSPMR